jgi:hypothetical protein
VRHTDDHGIQMHRDIAGLGEVVRALPSDFLQRLDNDVEASGGELAIDEEMDGAIGATMFDLPNSENNTVTVLLPQKNLQRAPSQALVRIQSRDDRRYLGIVSSGPFAEPDSLRGDSHMLVTVLTRGGIYLPPFHGRVQVSLLGEEHEDGTLSPPRLRPLPNSRVFAVDDTESAALLHADGDIRLGLADGHESLVVGVPSRSKDVLPRHTAVLGTTGSGKSTTIAHLVQQAQATGMAVVLLDVEGEYTFLHKPTEDTRMLSGLAARGQAAVGIPADKMALYHLVGRETANPTHPHLRPFSLQFARLSPYQVIEILRMSDAQTERFLKAYDVAKAVLRDLGIFPTRGDSVQEQLAIDIDEFERGYPRLTLAFLLDIVGACLAVADNTKRLWRGGICEQGSSACLDPGPTDEAHEARRIGGEGGEYLLDGGNLGLQVGIEHTLHRAPDLLEDALGRVALRRVGWLLDQGQANRADEVATMAARPIPHHRLDALCLPILHALRDRLFAHIRRPGPHQRAL